MTALRAIAADAVAPGSASPIDVIPSGASPSGASPSGASLIDAALIEESLRRPDRFGEIYDRYFAEIYRYVASRLGPDVADDLAAETFLVAFRRRGRFDAARGAVRSWLYGIATNLVGQHRRVEARRYRTLAKVAEVPATENESEGERIAERVSARTLRRPLMLALARLSAGDRDVLLLVSIGGLSYEEVALALSIAPGTVGSRLNRARRKVSEALGGANPLLADDIEA
jgi:RNA polymerase sigma factor (sigma-70 family)